MNQRVKHLFISVATAMAALTAVGVVAAPEACAEGRGSKSVGLRTGYNSNNESALAGIYFQYRFSNHFRLSPNADYIFKHHGTDGFSINVNAHVPFDFAGGRWSVYPLAGVSHVTWSTRYNDAERLRRTHRESRFGINLGAGMEWHVTSSLKLMAEGKFNWVRHDNAGVVSVGLGYVF